MIRSLILLTATVALSGCISLLPDGGDLPPRITLDAGPPVENSQTPTYDASLTIADPSSAALLNTFSVAISKEELAYQYLPDAEWTDRVPVLVRRFLVRRFEDSHHFTAVGDRTELVRSDYLLRTDIREFHLDATGTEEARVTVSVIFQDGRGNVLGARSFSAKSAASSTTRQSRAQALNRAAGEVADALIEWVDEVVGRQASAS